MHLLDHVLDSGNVPSFWPESAFGLRKLWGPRETGRMFVQIFAFLFSSHYFPSLRVKFIAINTWQAKAMLCN